MAAKHFMFYYKRGTGTFVVTEPRPWARENPNLFPDYNFAENFPNTTSIENLLIERFGFTKVIENEEVVLLQNLDININI
jgi:hypothetical protein